MTTELKKFVSKYIRLSADALEEIAGKFKSRAIKKNDYLLREGETCRDLVFVQKGCLRLYYLKDDIEVSVWFAFEQSSAIEIYSFISENPSNYFLQAIEDSEILYLPKAEEYGWSFGGELAGHLIGEFPHERLEPGNYQLYVHLENHNDMFLPDAKGNKREWILEMHFVDTGKLIGGFFEQLLT